MNSMSLGCNHKNLTFLTPSGISTTGKSMPLSVQGISSQTKQNLHRLASTKQNNTISQKL